MIKLPPHCVRLLLIQRDRYRSRIFSGRYLRKILGRKNFESLYFHKISHLERIFQSRVETLYSAEMADTYRTFQSYIPKRLARTLDIGAGMAGINILIHRSAPAASEIWLLDKDGESEFWNAGYHENASSFSHYNSFTDAIDCLSTNGIEKDRIRTIDISRQPFPREIGFDLVTSFLSWGFHYPVSTYLDDVYTALTPGGLLVMDIRKDTPGKDLLAAKFGNEPISVYEEKKFVRYAVSKPQ
jgi:hypothetical protein